MKNWKFYPATALTVAGVVLSTTASNSLAAPPPSGYPSSQVLQRTYNPKLGTSIPLRRGFYDAAANHGFGWDKLWNKHKITDLRAVAALSGSTAMQTEGTSRVFFTWAGKYKCQSGRCTLQKQQKVRLVVVTTKNLTYSYKPKGATKKVYVPIGNGKEMWGVQTAYCEGMVECPTWVTFSLANPGLPNPFLNAPAGPSSAAPRQTGSPEAHTRSNDSVGSEDELNVYSYKPLPQTSNEKTVSQAETSSSPLEK